MSAELLTPYNHTYEWGDAIAPDELPSPETLTEIARALHAVDEFMLERVATAVKTVTALENDDAPVAPEQRGVTYAYLGQLHSWLDEIRHELAFLGGTVETIGVAIHGDLTTMANGYAPTDPDPKWDAQMARFHGLDHRTQAA